jgi:hypothetical protein
MTADPHSQAFTFVHNPLSGQHQQFNAPAPHWTAPTSPAADPHSAATTDTSTDVAASHIITNRHSLV